MTNLPIQHANLPQESGYYQGINDEFSVLQGEYDKAVKKLQGSDFANSPVAYENELTMLKKLIAAAKEQGLTEKVKQLEAREQEIYTKIANNGNSASSIPFYRPVIAGTISQTPAAGDFAIKGHKEINFKGDPFASFLVFKFDDVEAVKNGINEICNSGIDKNKAIKILYALKVTDKETQISKVDPKTMHYIAEMKSTFVKSRNNEKAENDNPIKHLNEVILKLNGEENRSVKFIYRKGKLIYSTPISGEPSQLDMIKQYNKAVQEEEDAFLQDFVNKYKTEDGIIDNKYVRIFTALRQFGITKNNLFELIDSCIKDDGSFDRDKLLIIGELKQAGVLSEDINVIIDSAKNPQTGEFNRNYIERAKALTKDIMEGKDVATILNRAKGNEDAYEFILKYADIFKDPNRENSCFKAINQLSNIVKNKDGEMDKNAIDIVDALFANSSIFNDNNEISSTDFIKLASDMINFVKKASIPRGMIDDSTTEAIFRMCHNSIPVDVQYTILENCMDENKNIDSNLAKIAWNMVSDDEDTETIIEMLQSCHNGMHVDTEKARETLELFDVYIPDNYEA